MMEVKGKIIDNQTRCEHYHSAFDVIAIKFKCCNDYYPCHKCHQQSADHEFLVWKKEERNIKAILCGVCKNELTIQEYLDCKNECPACHAKFNPGCGHHFALYFEM